MTQDVHEVAKKFLNEQMQIMRKYGSEPKLTDEQYDEVLAETEKTFRGFAERSKNDGMARSAAW